MKIGVDARDMVITLTGMGRYIFDLMIHLAPLDESVHYILYSHRPIERFPFRDHPNISNCVASGPLGLFAKPRELWKNACLPFVAKRDKIEVLFLPSNITPIIRSTPVVMMIHDVLYARHPEWCDRKTWMQAKLAIKFAQNADIVLVPSAKTKNDLIELGKCPESKINVIHHGCKLDFSDTIDFYDQDLDFAHIEYFLFVGFDYVRRNIPGLIKAFGEALEVTGRDFHLVIAGGTDRRSHLESVKNSTGFGNKIHLQGHVDDNLLKYLYTNAVGFLYPSVYEGFGFPVLEAISAGLPVVVPNTATMPEVAGDAGIYFDPDDPDGIKNAIIKVMNSPELRLEYSEKSRIQAAKFSWQKTAEKTLELLKRAAEMKKK